jgi:protein ImuB
MVHQLDCLLGRSDSRIVPRRPVPPVVVERRFAEPIAHAETALAVLAELAGEAAQALEQRGAGGRHFIARFFRSDGAVRDIAVETGLPTRDVPVLERLFRERVEALADPIDPGFGFDLIRLGVARLERVGADQFHLEGGMVAETELAGLIDRLSIRLGRNRVRRFAPRDTHIPEQAVLALPAIEAGTPAPWESPVPGEPPLRPLHLFDPPQRIEVIGAEVPDGPPRQFRWRRAQHDVARFEGPERIAPEWWRLPSGKPGLTRDYYRIEDVRGRRFWIFRHGLFGREREHPEWYLHGLFA